MENYVLDCVSDNLYYILNNPEGVRIFKISKTANSLEHVIHHCKDQLGIENLVTRVKIKDIEDLPDLKCDSIACNVCPCRAALDGCVKHVAEIYRDAKMNYDRLMDEFGEREVNLYEKTIL